MLRQIVIGSCLAYAAARLKTTACDNRRACVYHALALTPKGQKPFLSTITEIQTHSWLTQKHVRLMTLNYNKVSKAINPSRSWWEGAVKYLIATFDFF
ncbi:hypothetical protein CEXT_581101 [Caerostris extrusa]|uniref:Secreted protein n=1 Tax=Caerostris extrusa TaxID=172846 RepID=A0AAV4R167_CAEEX|nr:hypothetical protein CEXT_581101 [Caerostris extrusa]